MNGNHATFQPPQAAARNTHDRPIPYFSNVSVGDKVDQKTTSLFMIFLLGHSSRLV
jgi:hypothetical protein